MVKQTLNSYKKILFKYRGVILITLLMLFAVLGRVFGATVFEDTFNDYNLGNLGGQGGWVQTGAESIQVTDDDKVEGAKGLKHATTGQNGDIRTGTGYQAGQTVVYAKFPSGNADAGYGTMFLVVKGTDIDKGCGFYFLDFFGQYVSFTAHFPPLSSQTYAGEFEFDTWHKVTIKWDTTDETTRCYMNVNDGDWVTSSNYFIADYALDTITLTQHGDSSPALRKLHYLDFISEVGELAPPPMRIWGHSPNTATEITSLGASFTAKWENIDPEIYDGIMIYFQNDHGIASTPFYQEIEASSGTIETDFEAFGLDKNGDWHFRGIGYYQELDTYGGMYLTDRGYVQKYTGNLVTPTYYIDLNIEGFEEIFYMTDFETWYGAEVEEFDAPTGTFLRFADFFSPIFDKIGAFAGEMEDIFNGDVAYDKGYALGLIIPLAKDHFEIIRVFTGGFPVFEFLTAIIVIMFAIILIKIITKFIPFFH